jgi:hypothetical protein
MRVKSEIQIQGLVFLKLSLRKISKLPPHLNPLPPGERKKEKWEKARMRVKAQNTTCCGISLH